MTNQPLSARRPDREPAMPVEIESRPSPVSWVWVGIAWVLVGLPLAWGIYKTFEKAAILFRI